MTPAEIRKLREERGLSQSELAQKIGVTTNAVQHWEYGIRRPSSPAQKALEDLADNT